MKFEFDAPPEAGHTVQVCEQIQWACMPLPFALDHVNCWILGEPYEDDQVVIDTGIDDAATRAYWQQILETTGRWPSQLLVTHFHPDHMGLAGWFAGQGTQALTGTKVEVDIAAMLYAASGSQYAGLYESWYSSHGLPAASINTVRDNGNTYQSKVHEPPTASQWQYVDEGQVLTLAGRQYRVIIGRGHAPYMIMLFREDDHVLIAADQVLPSISPNVSVMPRLEDNNPLGSFLHSLTCLEGLPDDTLVLPSHGLPFRGLKQRLHDLKAHHDQRLEKVLQACRQKVSAFELFEVLYRRQLDAQQTSFALGEALAHLHYLEQHGRLSRFEENGLIRFMAN